MPALHLCSLLCPGRRCPAFVVVGRGADILVRDSFRRPGRGQIWSAAAGPFSAEQAAGPGRTWRVQILLALPRARRILLASGQQPPRLRPAALPPVCRAAVRDPVPEAAVQV